MRLACALTLSVAAIHCLACAPAEPHDETDSGVSTGTETPDSTEDGGSDSELDASSSRDGSTSSRDGSTSTSDGSTSSSDGSTSSSDGSTSSSDASTPPANGAFGDRWVMGYYAFGEQDVLPAKNIPWEDLTHVIADLGPSFIQWPAAGAYHSLDVARASIVVDGVTHKGADAFKKFAELANAHGVKALLHIGGYDTGAIETMAKHIKPANVGALVSDIVSACADFGFGGIDWEHYNTSAEDRTNTTAFFAKLKTANPALKIASDSLGADHNSVLPSNTADYAKAISASVDYAILRMVDGIGNDAPWTVWHHLPLYNLPSKDAGSHLFSLEIGLHMFTAAQPPIGIAISKLGAELPMWGVGIGPKSPTSAGAQMTDPGIPLAGPNDWNLFSWGRREQDWPIRRIMRDYVTAGHDKWDDDAKASYVSFWPPIAATGYGSETFVPFQYLTFVSYESARAAALKGAYLKCGGFGGAVVRSLNDATLMDGTNPVLRALSNAIKSQPTCP